MDQILAHLTKHAQIYGIVFVVLLVALLVIFKLETYETHVIRNLFKSAFRGVFGTKEGFQSGDIVAGGAVSPDNMNRDTCKALKEQIAQYEKVRADHKDVPIQNLDETLAQFKEYFVNYNCE